MLPMKRQGQRLPSDKQGLWTSNLFVEARGAGVAIAPNALHLQGKMRNFWVEPEASG